MNQDIPQALTFDDVLLEPCYSEILPTEVDTATELAPGISLHVPIVSAAMDTVTESRLAIAMAREGGLGFVHKNLSIEAQAKEVTTTITTLLRTSARAEARGLSAQVVYEG